MINFLGGMFYEAIWWTIVDTYEKKKKKLSKLSYMFEITWEKNPHKRSNNKIKLVSWDLDILFYEFYPPTCTYYIKAVYPLNSKLKKINLIN